MSTSKNPNKTPKQWLELITEARQSGLTDAEWCRRNSISIHTFNNAIRRLRKRACVVPSRADSELMDFTAPITQEVVKVGIKQESSPTVYPSSPISVSSDMQPAIEISLSGAEIRIYNSASPALVSGLLSALGGNL